MSDIIERLNKAAKPKKVRKLSNERKKKMQESINKNIGTKLAKDKSRDKRKTKRRNEGKVDLARIAKGSKVLKQPSKQIKKAQDMQVESWRSTLLKLDTR